MEELPRGCDGGNEKSPEATALAERLTPVFVEKFSWQTAPARSAKLSPAPQALTEDLLSLQQISVSTWFAMMAK